MSIEDFAAQFEAMKRIMFRLSLPMPHKLLSPNARCHYMAKAKQVKAARTYAEVSMVRAFQQAKMNPPEWSKAHYKAVFFCKTAAKRDPDNLMASLKSYIDGIADAGLVANDSGLWPQRPEIKKDTLNPRVEITLWEDAA